MSGNIGAWFFGELLPFGDLITDWVMLLGLDEECPAKIACDESHLLNYDNLKGALWLGTLLDSTPGVLVLMLLVAGLFGTLAGALSCGTCFPTSKGLSMITIALRYSLSDCKHVMVGLLRAYGGDPEEDTFRRNALLYWYYVVLVGGFATEVVSICLAVVTQEPAPVASALFGALSLTVGTVTSLRAGRRKTVEDVYPPGLPF
ncbi:unnamed protein product [Discosporangium mesarthrocarpum]